MAKLAKGAKKEADDYRDGGHEEPVMMLKAMIAAIATAITE